MANEIWHFSDEADVLYALIWRKTDDKVYDAVAASNTFDTSTDADILDYDVPLTNHADSDYHSVDFPTDIAAGVYRVQIVLQVGGAIDADIDYTVAQGLEFWDGSASLDTYTLDDSIATVDDIVTSILDDTENTIPDLINDDVIGVDSDTLETLSDQLDTILAQGGRVLNVYPK